MVTWPICSSCCNTLTHITVPTDQANQYSLIYIAIKESVRHTTPHHIAGELDFRSLYMYNKINDNNSITERIHTFWTIATIYRSVLFCLVSGCFWFFLFRLVSNQNFCFYLIFGSDRMEYFVGVVMSIKLRSIVILYPWIISTFLELFVASLYIIYLLY